jgi:hypothetical protein
MAQQANVNINVSSSADTRGFKIAENSLNKLGKSVKNIASSLGLAYGSKAILNFGKSTVKAFTEDAAAAAKLTNVVKNLGLAYATGDIVKYIDSLTLATGVADNDLRPALQSLLQVTGSVTKSQELLSLAINVSRGSGEDLVTVANDISQAFVGNLKGLRKYNLGLTKAELASSSFAQIQEKLNSTFKGASAAYLATYAGKIDLITNSAKEAKEILGKGLVDALILVSGDTSVKTLSDNMQSFAEHTANAILGIGVLIDKLNNLPGVKQSGGIMAILDALPGTGQLISLYSLLDELGRKSIAAKNTFNFASGGGAGTGSSQSVIDAQAKAAELAAKKRQAEILKMQREAARKAAMEAQLKKNSALFDLSQIQLIAALKGQLSDEDRKRAELQLAILQNNTSEATKLAAEVALAQGLTKELVAYYAGLPDAKNPFAGWIVSLEAATKLAGQIANTSYAAVTQSPANAAIDTILSGYGSMPSPASAGVSATGDVNVYVAGSVVSEGDLVELVRDGLLNSSLSGSPSAIGRLKGSFAG